MSSAGVTEVVWYAERGSGERQQQGGEGSGKEEGLMASALPLGVA